MEINYTISLKMLQDIIGVLNNLPAGQVRGLLNSIEKTCIDQDMERMKEQKQKE
jgi:hypothetical protein